MSATSIGRTKFSAETFSSGGTRYKRSPKGTRRSKSRSRSPGGRLTRRSGSRSPSKMKKVSRKTQKAAEKQKKIEEKIDVEFKKQKKAKRKLKEPCASGYRMACKNLSAREAKILRTRITENITGKRNK